MSQLNIFLYSVSFEEIAQPNTRCNAKNKIKDSRECYLAASLFGLSAGFLGEPGAGGLWVSGCSYHIGHHVIHNGGDYIDNGVFNPGPKDGLKAKNYNFKSICKAPCKFNASILIAT